MQEHNYNDTITLFIFRSNARGMQYGIGTYIHELTEALLQFPGINIFLVSYKSTDNKEFSVRKICDRFSEIKIPAPLFPTAHNNGFDKKYAASVIRLISDIIPGKGQVIFQFNYIDDLSIIIRLKECFNFPVISIVHFAHWQQIFEGNRKKLAGLNIDNPTNNIEFTLSREKEMYMVADRVVSVTNYMRDFLTSEYGIDPCKINVVPNGLDLSGFHPVSPKEKVGLKKKLGFSSSEKIILFSGRIDASKGIFFLAEAFCEACKRSDDIRLVVIGQGDLQECLKRCNPFYGKITFAGFLSRDQVREFYRVADIGVVPSVYEQCSYTVLEMMANSIPLIVSRINGLNEVLDNDSCLFIDPVIDGAGDITFNTQELSGAILALAGDKALRTRLAASAYKLCVRKFSSAAMAEEMNNLFHTLTNNKKAEFEYEKSGRR